MLSALLIDLDGVLRLWSSNHDQQAEQQFDLPCGTMRAIAFAPDLLPLAITGQIPDETWRVHIVERLAAQFPACDARGAVQLWSSPVGEVDQHVRTLLRWCRQRVPVGLVTNATSRLPHDLEALQIANEFDVIINSSVVGAAKPDRRIFRAAVDALRVSPETTLFIDDTARNVEAAQAFGMRGHVYEGYSKLEKAVKHYLEQDGTQT